MIYFRFDAFRWQRPARRKQGFAWEGTGDERRLVRVAGAAFVDYDPPITLFRDFADLDGTAEAVLDFANRYGGLGQTKDHLMDYLASWRQHIAGIRELVQLAEALDSGDGRQIKTALGTITPEDKQAISERRQKPDAVVNTTSITTEEYAHAALARIGRVLLTRKGFFENLSLEGGWDQRTSRVQARFRHDHLIGFMRFQLGVSLIEGWSFRRCEGCGKWFRLAPGVNRADRTTCTPSCRFQQYRRRRRRAVELHQGGWTPKAIAAEIGSDVRKVKEWIKKASQRTGD
jgi:hypothetical protein